MCTFPIRFAGNSSYSSGIRCITTIRAPEVCVWYKWSISGLRVNERYRQLVSIWVVMENHDFFLTTFSDTVSTANQSDIIDSNQLIKYDLWFTSWFTSWVNLHNVLVAVISSAYKMKLRRPLRVCIWSMYIPNNNGPNTEPCGTPVSSSFLAEFTPPYSTYWVRSKI